LRIVITIWSLLCTQNCAKVTWLSMLTILRLVSTDFAPFCVCVCIYIYTWAG
jgi:hypothetical protein